MRADGSLSRFRDQDHTPAACPRTLTGPLAAAMNDASRGRTEQALQQVDTWLSAYAADRDRDHVSAAVSLKVRCLIDRKRPAACRPFLDEVIGRGWLDADDPAVRIAELHLALLDEDHAAVRDGAVALLTIISNQADPRHAELRLLHGAALRWLGDTPTALREVEFAHAAFTVLDDPARAAVAANFMGWTHLAAGRLEDARRWFEKSLAVHEELGHSLRMAQTYQNLAIVCYKQGDYDVALELLDREQELVADHPDMICRALVARGNIRRLQGEFATARRHLLEAYSLATEKSLAREQALCLEFLGDVLRDEGNPAEARLYYRRGLGVARALAPRGDLVMELLRRRGECLDLEGDHIEANAVLTEAAAIGKAVDDRFEIAAIRRCLGLNAANLGRWQLATDHLEASLRELRDMRARHEAMLSAYHLARTLLRRIDAGQAGAAADRLLETAWQAALQARQWEQELGVGPAPAQVGTLVRDISRRRHLAEDGMDAAPAVRPGFARSTRVIAVSETLRQVLQRCDGFSRYKNPVLLEGESGTGKELLARRIHETSPRGSVPLVVINCASASPEALAREIFGTAPGGAPHVRRRMPGLVNQAEGGALLLKNIEDLPRDLQGRILRFIQEGVYRPVGDGRERLANVRVLATCEADLAKRTEQGFFRQDLYFRLKQMHVAVPPLRERSEDIVPLLDHFLSRLDAAHDFTARQVLDLPGLEALVGHAWPGNAVELEALAQQIWVNRQQGRPCRLRLRDTAHGRLLELVEGPRRAGSGRGDHPSGMTWNSLVALIERAGGNKARVARNLGISRVTLYRWLDQLNPE